jgi:hypothetical protein
METMFSYAKTIIKAVCHDYYQETCVLLMFLALLVAIVALWITITRQPTRTPGAADTRTLRAERRRHQA